MSQPSAPIIALDTDNWMQDDDLLGETNFQPYADPRAIAETVPPVRHERPSAQIHAAIDGRFVIAIDYGTTYTGFAWANTPSDHAELDDIEVLQEWTSNMSNQEQVPSVISYSKTSSDSVQWGSDFTDKAITISRTKLELEPQPVIEELDLLWQVLKGTGCMTFQNICEAEEAPTYTSKSPETIIQDYLRKIFECANNELNLSGLNLTGLPIDIVLTVPVGWSPIAYGSIFRALRGAGFNRKKLPTLQDTIMLTEAEAAAYYTAREIANRESLDFLKPGDCFILCDAGGGTVDLVSFQVKQTIPYLELEKITQPTGGRFGSSLIDHRFKGWLRNAIGPKNYAVLDPDNAQTRRISPHTAETGPMRALMKQFNMAKADFEDSPRGPNITFDLSKYLGNVHVRDRMSEGFLTIRRKEMQKLMDYCVTGVLKLIQEQIENVTISQKGRIRDIILVGGFGASPYLRSRLQRTATLKEHNIGLRRPEKALTAVVQGAVIYGIEKDRHNDAEFMLAMPRSYGVRFKDGKKDRFEWLVKKGSLALTTTITSIDSNTFSVQAADLTNGRIELKVYTYRPRDEDDEDPPTLWAHGKNDIDVAGAVTCNLTDLLASDRRQHPNSLSPGPKTREIGPLRWQFEVLARKIEVKVIHKGVTIGQNTIKLDPVEMRGRKRSQKG